MRNWMSKLMSGRTRVAWRILLMGVLCLSVGTAAMAGTFTWDTGAGNWDACASWVYVGQDCDGSPRYPSTTSDDAIIPSYPAGATVIVNLITDTIDDLSISWQSGGLNYVEFRSKDGGGNTLTADTVTITGPTSGSLPLQVLISDDARILTN